MRIHENGFSFFGGAQRGNAAARQALMFCAGLSDHLSNGAQSSRQSPPVGVQNLAPNR